MEKKNEGKDPNRLNSRFKHSNTSEQMIICTTNWRKAKYGGGASRLHPLWVEAQCHEYDTSNFQQKKSIKKIFNNLIQVN